MSILHQTKQLINSQLQKWELAANNYAGLQKVRTKSLTLPGGAEVKVQFNPERIRSSSAKVDAQSIQERSCFLCAKNRPAEQEGVEFGNYSILINPFPIFQQHLTIPHQKHTVQIIEPYFSSMLDLARELNDFTLFYNGPKCGASAPDHFHFQAGNKGFLPLEDDFKREKFTKLIANHKGIEVYTWSNYHRGVISFKGSDVIAIKSLFDHLHKVLFEQQMDELEPMLNVLTYFESGEYVVHVFPRVLHRPKCYFAKGDEQILLSPASVDMGGVFITPRAEDFEKITASDVTAILDEVCMSEHDSALLAEEIVDGV
ncbi:DUF4922 domain-containing protein [Carboxylicivirga sp. M1479]|uniref:DUF4922 domain-containing protein n=1 Tax=Carboxylicivirga sp. M1479 TaxID=2594476 RepID=UPI0011783E38|nr:DUF4922 domain-containing protein [Carboxylicivirga sp. M1479]TRX64282.1 DUF4922 domain-containing protein [Carboxylicivirga sp. M1479]